MAVPPLLVWVGNTITQLLNIDGLMSDWCTTRTQATVMADEGKGVLRETRRKLGRRKNILRVQCDPCCEASECKPTCTSVHPGSHTPTPLHTLRFQSSPLLTYGIFSSLFGGTTFVIDASAEKCQKQGSLRVHLGATVKSCYKSELFPRVRFSLLGARGGGRWCGSSGGEAPRTTTQTGKAKTSFRSSNKRLCRKCEECLLLRASLHNNNRVVVGSAVVVYCFAFVSVPFEYEANRLLPFTPPL